MNIKNKISTILLPMIESNLTDCKKYEKLELKDVPSIKKSDLPLEFCEESFEINDAFIKKTSGLKYEILLYFDYITGKILKCKIGSKTNVELEFEENEFKGKHVASLHNHTKDMYTPPSDKNFGIFSRDWEDYELIACGDCLWVLKGKLKDEKLTFELKIISNILFNIALENATKMHQNQDTIDDQCDEQYGNLLSKFINDKNISKIQLEKREYDHDQNKN